MMNTDEIKRIIREMKIRDGFLYERTPCSEADNEKYRTMQMNDKPLPENVFPYTHALSEMETGKFYRLHEPRFTHEEIMEYLALKTAQEVKKIKRIAVAILILLCSFAICSIPFIL